MHLPSFSQDPSQSGLKRCQSPEMTSGDMKSTLRLHKQVIPQQLMEDLANMLLVRGKGGPVNMGIVELQPGEPQNEKVAERMKM